MNKIKIDKGERVVMDVVSVSEVPSNYGPEVRFSGRTAAEPDAAIFLKVATADRQLGRLGLTRDTAVNRTLEFAKPDKYIDINIPANGQGTPAAPAPKPATPVAPTATPAATASNGNGVAEAEPNMKATQFRKTVALYEACLDHVLKVSGPKLAVAEVGSDPQSIAAMTATLFIRCTSRGLDA